MLSKNDKMFDVLYESTLAAKGIQHLDCELLKEFAEALYNYGYADGVCTTIDNEFPVI